MTTRRERLAELMEERRLDLKLTWREVGDAAGITTETLRQIRFGTAQIQKLTQRRVEEALAWEAGGIGRFLDGGDPPTPASGRAGELDRVCLLIHGMTAEQLYKTVVESKAIALGDRANFRRTIADAIGEGTAPAGRAPLDGG